jgi:hypothetical protein
MTCSVCGEPVDDRTSAVCNWCGERFHLNPRNDVPGKDCGEVWVNEQYLALEFACRDCLRAQQQREALKPQVRAPRIGRRRYRRRE